MQARAEGHAFSPHFFCLSDRMQISETSARAASFTNQKRASRLRS
jgi:hypothetical protein